jgi:zinc and cadmium transporter
LNSAIAAACLVALIAIVGVIAGVYLSAIHAISRPLVAFSGGVLVGVAAFWVFPELREYFGWTGAALWVAAGFIALWATDRYVYRVCPSCSHTHDHDSCSTRLHGFAGPVLTAAAFHAFLDGWILAASAEQATAFTATGVVVGIAIHKLPEGLALGVIVRASLRKGRSALWASIAAEALTAAGAAAAVGLAPSLGTAWAHSLLALAAGSFLFLGYHAVHSEYRRGGLTPALMPSVAGVAGAAIMRVIGTRWFGV